jgi:hypothetical protein
MSTRAGLQIMHNGSAVELLYHLRDTSEGQVWKVKPLFVVGPEREETIRATDTCRALHSERRPCRVTNYVHAAV